MEYRPRSDRCLHQREKCHGHSDLYQSNASVFSYVSARICSAGSASHILEREEDNKTRYESDGSSFLKRKLNMARVQEKCA